MPIYGRERYSFRKVVQWVGVRIEFMLELIVWKIILL
jgi:hypothetical protein